MKFEEIIIVKEFVFYYWAYIWERPIALSY